MNKSTLGFIAILFLAVVSGAYFLSGEDQSVSEQTLVFPELEAQLNQISKLTIQGANENTLVTLEKREDTWTVLQKQSYAANMPKLREFLQKLAKTRRREQKTSKPELYSKLGVEDVSGASPGGLLVGVLAGEADYRLIVGNTMVSGPNSSYVRLPDVPDSWLVNQDLSMEANPLEWLQREIVDVAASRIQRVVVDRGGVVLAVSKENRVQANFMVEDVPEGRELKNNGIADSLAGVLSGLELDDVMRGTQELPEPEFQAKYQCFDGLVVVVRGYKIADGNWIQISAEADAQLAQLFYETPITAAAESSGEVAADATPEEAVEPVDTGPDMKAIEEEVLSLNQRTSAWIYAVADYQYDQMNKTIEDLIDPQ